MSRVIKNDILKEHRTTPLGLHKLDIEDENNQLIAHKVDIGFVRTEQMKKLIITKKQVLEFISQEVYLDPNKASQVENSFGVLACEIITVFESS